ncbi:adenosine deaminase [Nocardia sp. CDC159]|uniref:Adenine deaminase n=1 Tax=Nocardia pulmonis TaxID=2951408 RepID=A0A9X2ED29_9NOCA|nr:MULTISPECIES: adenosine deaminase [Nocardia]MCM6778547.1 adenosine deaminase [Nocardia pulmonis]MCM6791436.1 adenosine deaminase [Nocardia sp. CDC159]
MPVPKAELHLHIEGTLEPELAFALAERNGAELPFASVEELRHAYRFEDLQSFLDLYYRLTDVLRTERDFTELAEAYLRRARAEGVRHAEIFFDPQAHTSRGVPFATVIDGLWAALRDSEARHGITTSLILCFLRDLSAESALETLAEAEPYLDRIVAVGLDSAEVGHPPAKFAEVYRRARELGLRAVAHAGEEGPPSYIAEALDILGVERIDHGVRVLEDPILVQRLVRDRIPLTVCPFSNVRLRVIDQLTDHPLRRMLDLGLLATVNSDDPAYFGGYVEENLQGVRKALNLTPTHLRTLARNSFEAAFLDIPTRDRYLAEVDAYSF